MSTTPTKTNNKAAKKLEKKQSGAEIEAELLAEQDKPPRVVRRRWPPLDASTAHVVVSVSTSCDKWPSES